jgi:putative hydrolase of the HAD superfamily
MTLKYILFDLDETLYPPGSGLLQQIGQRIQAWLCNHLALEWDEASALRSDYFDRYGTTLGGLLTEREVDAGDFLTFVHDIPVEAYVGPNPALSAMLNAIPLRRVVYTNGTAEYAWRVLRALELTACFERVIGIEQVGLRSKLYRDAYERALALIGVQGDECIMVEDSVRNLRPAKELGLTTVLVQMNSLPRSLVVRAAHSRKRPQATTASDVDFVVKDILAVGNIVQDLLRKTQP